MRFKNLINSILEDFVSKKLTIPSCPESNLSVKFLDEELNTKITEDNAQKNSPFPFARTKLFKVPVLEAHVLVDNKFCKKVIELIIDDSNISELYQSGDTIGILPQNLDDEINIIIESLNLLADNTCQISLKQSTRKKNSRVPVYIPEYSTARKILKECLNIRSPPKKLFLRSLLEYTYDENEKRFLEILCSKEGTQCYNKCISEEQITILDIFKLCSSCCPPFEILLEHLPRLLPRPYSIVNNPIASSNDGIKIIFSLLENDKCGLTTGMMEKFIQYEKNTQHYLNIYFRETNKFRYTKDDYTKNQILIGIGCGVSPFLGFLQYKNMLSKFESIKNPGKTWLFSGSRYKNNSIYRKEFLELRDFGILNEFYESFSREDENLSQFKYIQNNIENNSEDFVQFLLNENTTVFICADGDKISQTIQNCIINCIQTVLNITEDDANQMIIDFKKKSKYIEDIWL